MVTKLDRREYYSNWKKRNPELVKERAKQAMKKFREEHPDQYRKIYDKRREKRRRLINEIKDNPCKDCGNKFPPECMDFDHVKGKKTGSIYQLYMASLQKLNEELAKCDLVCANCHRIRTRKRTPPVWEREGENA